MVILLNAPPKKKNSLNQLMGGIAAGAGSIGSMLKEKEERKIQEEQLGAENEFAREKLGIDLSGVNDPKMRQELAKQAYQAKLAPQMYKDKYDARLGALQDSPFGKYLSNGQQQQQNSSRQDIMNDQGEIEVGNVKVPSMIPEQAIFNAEAVGEHGLAQQFREHNKQILESDRHRENVEEKRKRHEEDLDYRSFKDNKDYIEKVVNGYEAYKRDQKVLDAMDTLSNKGNLPTPFLVKTLDKLGIPLGILQNPDAEQFEKLSQELMKNIQGTYGNRILQTEVQNFMKSIPTLINSPEGQKRIIQQWKILNEGKKIYYDSYKDIKNKNPKRLPSDLHEQVLEKADEALDRLSNKFKNLSQIPTDYVKKPGKLLVIDPSGIMGEIDHEFIEQALREGYEFLE